MSKPVAVILSGCGVFDGAEINETVLTLLRLEQQGATYQCFAPNVAQHHVINHLNGEAMAETRNVLVEAARICRGAIRDVAELAVDDFAAVILPGGFGVAKNLSNFAFAGADCTVQADVLAALKAFAAAGKPVGLECIAPALAAKIFGPGVRCTIGNDADTAAAVTASGAHHQSCVVSDIVEDSQCKLVTTPAYMLAGSLVEAAQGINKLVDRVLALA
ncbi:isoprenoid biosynthesis glyoxalase ElbB [Atopomonas sediminilitoris]|uniref:isoprenoid biosynthesis glyoxalase ElbB n=1 Tax=Atopomonas sediminilitoris TaxID=2919919 RepID=UPI001F4E0192|nr:isoprenoid biosynthesis glyoxalase ElbB [Atopomonas sediminilitoris]MCJ8169560.1 isoprenoid biosynthesis glyoxalase ElbB [Atopomonas sediminilitoris]